MHTVVPLQRSAAGWLQRPGRIWLSWSIFNPNGPTVHALGLRDTEVPGRAEVFHRWMHFLGGEDYRLGYVETRADDVEARIAELFRGAFALQPPQGFARFPLVTCIPSLVVSNVSEDWQGLFKACIEHSTAIQAADWGRENYLLAKYGNRLFDRAGEELREAYENLRREHPAGDGQAAEQLDLIYKLYQQVPTFAAWEPGRYASRGLQAGDFEAWWEAITAVSFWPPVTAQLAHAWNNAVKQSTLPCRTPLAEVRDFFAAYDLPIFSALVRQAH